MKEIKISPSSARTLKALLRAADNYAFMGAAHPDDWTGIEKNYRQQIQNMKKLIEKLETAK